MEKFLIKKSNPLVGTVRVDGAKNSVLKLMAATILSNETCVLEGVPDLRDVHVMKDVLEALNMKVDLNTEEGKVTINHNGEIGDTAPYELVQKMRASVTVMGPLLARNKRARISMPGGCAIGARPIDLHLKGFQALGAEINLGHGYIEAVVKDRLKGAKIYLDYPSVGATENIMMAATMAEGTTVLENVAKEPGIIDLANFLNEMGAKVKGAGTDTIKIIGVERLGGSRHEAIPDRIVVSTYMIAAAMTKGDIRIENVVTSHVKPVTAKLKEIGAEVIEGEDFIRVIGKEKYKPCDVTTLPYPGFPTDAQSPFMALLSVVEGTSIISETVFENRFKHVAELNRMGASIKIEGHSAVIQGVEELQGAQVEATDLRAGAALILCGLIAEGETEVSEIYHIDRGYPHIEDQLRSLGANISRVDL